MRYLVVDFELTAAEPTSIRLGPLEGVWVLVRLRGHPLGWLKYPPGSCGRALHRDLILTDAAKEFYVRSFDLLTMSDDPNLNTDALPTISVIVCTRNHPDVLRRQLTSLSKLVYPKPFEVVVVDNAPTDDQTKLVCQDFAFVNYVREPIPGLDFARNTGLKTAQYDVVSYTDDDAVVDSGWLMAIGRNFLQPTVHCVTGLSLPYELETPAQRHFETYGGMQRGFRRKVYRPLKHWTTFMPLGSGAFGAGVNMSLRREIVNKLGGFDNALDTGSLTRGGGDLDMMARVIKNGGTLVYDPRAIIWHQHRPTMKHLRRQMWDYGYGFYAYLGKYARHDLELGNQAIKLMLKWMKMLFWNRFKSSVKLMLRGKTYFPLHLQFFEFAGALFGWRVYEKAVRHAEQLKTSHGRAG